jgi:hypothetical protein
LDVPSRGNVAKLTVLTLEGVGITDVTDWFNAGHSEVALISMLDSEQVAR